VAATTNAVRVAVVQAGSVPFESDACVSKAVRLIGEAARDGAKVIVFPEAFIVGYPKGLNYGLVIGARDPVGREEFRIYLDAAIEVPGPQTQRLGEAAAAQECFVVMGVIEREHRLTLYRPRQLRNSKVCSYTSNAVVMGPTNAVSPCCLITPKPTYGSVDDPRLLLAFKNGFIEGRLPAICRGCHMLGAEQF